MGPLLLAALAAAPLSYAYREDPKTHVRTYEVTDWSKQPRVWTATAGAQVRERADADAGVLGELPFGVEVKVLQVMSPEVVELNGRADRWYRVASEGKAGYVFGAWLTSARYEDDFDGDGEKELATVAMESAETIRVRFYEPKEKTFTSVDVSPAGGGFIGLEGGYGYPEPIAKAKAGLPLVHVGSHVEACATFSDYWVSYRDGKPQLAMTLGGIADPPNMVSYRVEFQPAKKRALVHWERVEEESQPPHKWSEPWALDGGVFVAPSQSVAR